MGNHVVCMWLVRNSVNLRINVYVESLDAHSTLSSIPRISIYITVTFTCSLTGLIACLIAVSWARPNCLKISFKLSAVGDKILHLQSNTLVFISSFSFLHTDKVKPLLNLFLFLVTASSDSHLPLGRHPSPFPYYTCLYWPVQTEKTWIRHLREV